MTPTPSPDSMIVALAMTDLDEGYGRFRLVNPAAEEAMLHSIRTLGQLNPIVVGKGADRRWEVIDGFKRLRALKKLDRKQILTRELKGGSAVEKAAMIQLNGQASGLGIMDEALVVTSLHRDERLTQERIAAMLGRHKSWVCRRLSMLERLHEEIVAEVRLGLLSVSHGREMVRLPRGNQREVLTVIQKHGLSSRQAAHLVTELSQKPSTQWSSYLRTFNPVKPSASTVNAVPIRSLKACVSEIVERCRFLEVKVAEGLTENMSEVDWDGLVHDLGRIEATIIGMRTMLDRRRNKTPPKTPDHT